MAWNISAGAIRNPIPPIVLILALLFAGWTAYERLPINQLPNVDFGGFTVTVAQPGAAPAEMETQITQRIESALTAVEGVKRVTSTISPGVSTSTVEMESETDLGRAVDDARDAINRIRPELPADISEPVITRIEAATVPIGYYAVTGDGMTPEDISWFIDNDLQRELLAVPGVSQVQRLGGVDREIRIELDPARLLAYGVTADQISTQLRALNADLPRGPGPGRRPGADHSHAGRSGNRGATRRDAHSRRRRASSSPCRSRHGRRWRERPQRHLPL